MKKKGEKKTEADALRAELANISTVILTTFQGITVEDDTKLRRAVEGAGGQYKVMKNTLAQHAGAGTLKAGRNEILIKVCQNEQKEDWAQMWSFQLRTCDSVGSAVPATQSAQRHMDGAGERRAER